MSEKRFRVLVAAALSDGSIGPDERPVLDAAAKELGVGAADVERIITEMQEQGTAEGAIPSDPGERAKVFRALVDLVAADGEVDANELKFFTKIAPSFNLDALQVEDILRAAAEAKKG
jgi:tellurite resistance protein